MNRALSFLHVTTFYPPHNFGGDGLYVCRLAHALGDDGHQVDVIHCVDSYRLLQRDELPLPVEHHPNVSVTGLRSGFGWLSPLVSQQTGRPLLKRAGIRRAIAGKRYDVIHFHNISLFGPAILEMDADSAIKLYTTHEHWLICPTHVLWKFNSRACERPQCFRCTLMAKRPPQLWRYSRLLQRTAENVDRFLAPSRFTAEMHRRRGFAGRFSELPVFADRADEDWRHPGASPHARPYFLFVGRLELIKGAHTLLDAVRRLPGVDLLIAGEGSQASLLRDRAADSRQIRFLGAVAPAELGRFYAHALACLVPSLTYEPFPTVTIEAFARKTPVIARDLGGLSQIVEESEAGFVYRTQEELVEAMQKVASSESMRRELGESGYRVFDSMWSKEAHLARYYALLDEVAEDKLGRIPWRQGAASEGGMVEGSGGE